MEKNLQQMFKSNRSYWIATQSPAPADSAAALQEEVDGPEADPVPSVLLQPHLLF